MTLIDNLKKVLRAQAIEKEIRAVYSVSDELAILRQRETKPEEYKAYYDFVESVKQKIKK
jgi:hypothetical protein